MESVSRVQSVLPIPAGIVAEAPRAITSEEKAAAGTAYTTLRKARSDARYAGARAARQRKKEEEEAAKKKVNFLARACGRLRRVLIALAPGSKTISSRFRLLSCRSACLVLSFVGVGGRKEGVCALGGICACWADGETGIRGGKGAGRFFTQRDFSSDPTRVFFFRPVPTFSPPLPLFDYGCNVVVVKFHNHQSSPRLRRPVRALAIFLSWPRLRHGCTQRVQVSFLHQTD